MIPQCCLKHKDIAKKYMAATKARTEKDPWQSFLYGVALTMTMDSSNHEKVVKGLKRTFPTREETERTCKLAGTPYVPDSGLMYSANMVTNGICQNARTMPELKRTESGHVSERNPAWSHLETAMKDCDREAIRKHIIFRQQKGPDMLLLESGCQVPVIDRWMIRRVSSVSVEEETIKRIQSSKHEYSMIRDDIIKEAELCEKPVGEHHMSCWLAMLFGDNTSKAETYFNNLLHAFD